MKGWERRGHNRKPNFVVRGIYSVADWLGDFGYLVDQTKQTIGNFLLLTVNLIMLLCIIITSAAHSLQLLRYAGATGGLEYFLLIVWELLFITSSFLLDRAFKQGKYGEWQLWLPFVMGLAFIEASNIVGMAANLAGLLIGGSTFIVLLCLKWMLIWQMKNPDVSTKKTVTNDDAYDNISKAIQREILTNQTPAATPLIDHNRNAYDDIAKILEMGEKHQVENDGEVFKYQRLDEVESQENEVQKTGETDQEKPEKKTIKMDEDDQEELEKSPDKTGETTPKNKDGNGKKKNNISPKRKARIIEMARKWYKENGKLPGRVNLSKAAKCSEYEARKVLEQLKAEFEQRKAS